MSGTIFQQVQLNVTGLLANIGLGVIGLPDLQRPFVWTNVKIRDLFDSMYRGYPIGYLLFWATTPDTINQVNPRGIGADTKQVIPNQVVVDGQQRLTALYSVITGTPVVRRNYEEERVRIAFNPIDERFEVTSAAMERDKVWIPDISVLWSESASILNLVAGYLEGLEATREVSPELRRQVENSIMRVQGLNNFPLTSLVLSAETSEEDVADVFVRINSTGKALNQADFILTLMSVFWDEGRRELEQFCRDARTPPKDGPSPFNYFIEPDPDQLLRAGVGLAFRRARLHHVYSILRGKNLDTNEFSEEARVDQFGVLKDAQQDVVNLQNWHDFLKCIHAAGFRKPIRSGTTLIYCYVLYLIGRRDFHVRQAQLRPVIARWFFMATLTGRYTNSPESSMESDLAMLRDVGDAEGFVGLLEQACQTTLTQDFWDITLPGDLVNSSTMSPSLAAYEAAQVVLDAPALFSYTKLGNLLDPALHAHRSAVERHHLWPRALLEERGISGITRTNQVANYAYIEWSDNALAAAQPPDEYLPALTEGFNATALAEMYALHALPPAWETMEYDEFLQQRRTLMADVVRRGYTAIGTSEPAIDVPKQEIDLKTIIPKGESDSVEFKATLRMNLHTGQSDPKIEHAVLKTLAGFLNRDGGTLLIGVADDGTPVGIEADNFPNPDKMSLHLTSLVRGRLGTSALATVHQQFDDYEDSRVLKVTCERSSKAVYLSESGLERFFIRTGPSTTELTGSQIVDFVQSRFGA